MVEPIYVALGFSLVVNIVLTYLFVKRLSMYLFEREARYVMDSAYNTVEGIAVKHGADGEEIEQKLDTNFYVDGVNRDIERRFWEHWDRP